jgi:hypothetical protein
MKSLQMLLLCQSSAEPSAARFEKMARFISSDREKVMTKVEREGWMLVS